MKLPRSLLVGAALALLAGCSDDTPKSSPGADKKNDVKVSSAEPRPESAAKPTRTAASKPRPKTAGFNGLDKNSDGYLSRTEAKANAHLAANFKAADRNKDGKLNRTEYRAVVTKNEVKTAKASAAAPRKASAAAVAAETGVQPP